MRSGYLFNAVVLLLGVGFVIANFGGYHLGCSIQREIVNGVERMARVYCASSPAMLVWTAFSVPLFVTVLSDHRPFAIVGLPTWKRIFAACLIDHLVIAMTVIPVLALAPLIVEAFRTGNFVWHFERNYIVVSDWIHFAIFLTIILLFLLS